MAEYAERDPMELEPYFSRHMQAMTAENLHSKAAIAEELAYRDQKIERLERELAHGKRANDAARREIDRLRGKRTRQ